MFKQSVMLADKSGLRKKSKKKGMLKSLGKSQEENKKWLAKFGIGTKADSESAKIERVRAKINKE